MDRKYKNPPLIEALCEFQFSDSQEWDWTIPGLFYREISDTFPEKRQQNVVEMQLEAQGTKVSHQIQGGIARMQFLNKDKSVMIQIGPGNLVINQLPPYPNWPKFKALIIDILKLYLKTTAPSGLTRISVRYINHIKLSDKSAKASKYFRYYPAIPIPIPQNPSKLLLRTEIPFESQNGVLILTLASVPEDKPDQNGFILDLNFMTRAEPALCFETVERWLEKAHEQISEAFEASINNELRLLFEEV